MIHAGDLGTQQIHEHVTEIVCTEHSVPRKTTKQANDWWCKISQFWSLITSLLLQCQQPWSKWANKSHKLVTNYDITTTKQSTTKPHAHFIGHTTVGYPYNHSSNLAALSVCKSHTSWRVNHFYAVFSSERSYTTICHDISAGHNDGHFATMTNYLCRHHLGLLPVKDFSQASSYRVSLVWCLCDAGISLGMRPSNERCCYNGTTSLIGWTHT